MPIIRNAKELGVALRERRLEKGLTQTQVANLCNVSLRFITELERGTRTSASVSKVLMVCSRLALDVSVTRRELVS